jgi:hypothetical protein
VKTGITFKYARLEVLIALQLYRLHGVTSQKVILFNFNIGYDSEIISTFRSAVSKLVTSAYLCFLAYFPYFEK